MVEDRVTDSKRIAQLFASELTGLETGPLSEVAVVDADPDVTPAPDGPVAYAVEFRGEQVGSVSLYPGRARARLAVDPDTAPDQPAIPVERAGRRVVLSIESGAAVKPAVDFVRAALCGRA